MVLRYNSEDNYLLNLHTNCLISIMIGHWLCKLIFKVFFYINKHYVGLVPTDSDLYLLNKVIIYYFIVVWHVTYSVFTSIMEAVLRSFVIFREPCRCLFIFVYNMAYSKDVNIRSMIYHYVLSLDSQRLIVRAPYFSCLL